MVYYPRVDSLRFIAVLLVLTEHFGGILSKKMTPGYFGVDLFFVISGFLITSILFEVKYDSVFKCYFRFIVRRGLRIFPLYYFTVILLVFLNYTPANEYLIWLLTYTYNYAWVMFNIPDNAVNHFWSLSVEEQYYILWPIIILSLRDKRGILILLTSFIVLLGFTQYYFNVFPDLSPYNKVSLLTRMASIGIGSLGALITTNHSIFHYVFTNKVVEVIILGLVMICIVMPIKIKFIIFPFLALYLIYKSTKYCFLINIVNDILDNKMVIYLGSISYGIYLIHLPLGFYLDKVMIYIVSSLDNGSSELALSAFEKNKWLIQLPLFSIISFILASVINSYFEKPILKLKDKYFA